MAPTDGANYHFTPANLTELKAILADARQKGMTVRVSGQHHSQPPLVADDNRNAREDAVDAFLTNHDLMLQTVTAGANRGVCRHRAR